MEVFGGFSRLSAGSTLVRTWTIVRQLKNYDACFEGTFSEVPSQCLGGSEMSKVAFLALLTVLMSCRCLDRVGRADISLSLTCTIWAKERHKPGEPVIVHFTLYNKTNTDIYVLKYRTPLEGWLTGPDFSVESRGRKLPYIGPRARRVWPPPKSFYTLVKRCGFVCGKVDLTEGYDLTKEGVYRVAFVGQLLDVARKGDTVPIPKGALSRDYDLKSNSILIRISE